MTDDPDIQKLLDEILAKDVVELTPPNITFLRARRIYLTDTERLKFASVLFDEPEEIAEDEVSYGDLKVRARALGMDNPVGKSRADLEFYIETHKEIK